MDLSLQQVQVGGWREGLRWLVSLNVNTCGVKTGKICRGSVAAMLAIRFFSGERCWGPLQASHLEPWFVLLWGLYWEPLLFFLVAIHLYMTLPVSG